MTGISRIYQIYYDENQLQNLIYEPFFNKKCTVFFENWVIKTLIEQGKHLENDYFGVVSHKLKEKIAITKTNWRGLKTIANHSVTEFTPEQFEQILQEQRPDAMSFQRHMPHDPITFADNFHPRFSEYFKSIMNQIGYDWKPTRFQNVFYCNYFVAGAGIYERYANEMLIPAIEVMQSMPELMGDSKYPHQLPWRLQDSFNIKHYPYHTFICERMFSYYAHIHKLNCLHY